MFDIWKRLLGQTSKENLSIGKNKRKIALQSGDKNPEYIDMLNLLTQILNSLERNEIYTIEDLEKKGSDSLFAMRRMGVTSMNLIKKAYEEYTGKKLPVEEAYSPVQTSIEEHIETNQVVILPQIPVEITTENYSAREWLGANKFLRTNIDKNIPLHQLRLSLQTINVLNKANIKLVKDIPSISTETLFGLRGMGKTSLIKLSNELLHSKSSTFLNNSNIDLVTLLLSSLNEKRQRDVIIKRYGLKNGEKQTLEEIGNSYKLTRERIRQVEVRALKVLSYPFNPARSIISKSVEEVLLQQNGIISEEEADRLMMNIIGNDQFDGSSLLDLLADLNWLKRMKVGEVSIYSPLYKNFDMPSAIDAIFKYVNIADLSLTLEQIEELVKFPETLYSENGSIEVGRFILKSCQVHPHIEELREGEFSTYVKSHGSTVGWANMAKSVLEKEESPMHYVEIADKLNEMYELDKPLDARRLHSILIGSPIFAHIGMRGTYGLVEWGIRKESTVYLIEECIRKAGFPLHIDQILHYVSKHKDTSRGNIRSILDLNRKFVHMGEGMYDTRRS